MLAVVIALALAGLLRAFDGQTDASTTRSLVLELRAFTSTAGARPASRDLPAFSTSYLRSRLLPAGEVVAVVLPDGREVGSAGSQPVLGTPQVTGFVSRPPARGLRQRVSIGGRSYLVVAAPLVDHGRTVATVVAAADLDQVNPDVGRVRNVAIGVALVALLGAVAGTYLMLRSLLRRVGRITATAADIGSGSLDRRLHEPASDEVGQLAATFDAMADRLSAAMTAQRRLLSDVSHQLRTPLTVARGHLEVLNRTGTADPAEVADTVHVVIDEIDHMRALVEQLLMLGHALEPDFVAPEPVDLRSFCGELLDSARVLAPRRWVHAGAPDVVVAVDPAKMRGALLNLIDNAVRATDVDDVVALTAVRTADGGVVLAIEDSGPGILPEQREAVLERFARPGAADSEGSGLGLAIARAVARAHGGELTIGTSSYGGCRVALELPPTVITAASELLDEGDPACVS